ncbi:MAG: hypothetical protein D6702_06085 [Planctomycetota bacterium]|nr:MAG: hypothetical protein D6702_06085 [Planctomycetota bacterium]
MRPNWFLALRLPAGGWFAERVTPPPDGFRLFHPADLHLTLAFLGGCTEADAFRAWEENHCFDLGPIDATLGEVVPMGDPRRYSALSALLQRGRRRVEEAMGRCRARWLRAAGARPDHRPPKAHATLARPLRRAGAEERRRGLAWAASLDLAGVPVRLEELVLYTWATDRRERRFRCAAARKLGA